MDLNILKIFYIVAKEGSMSKAADKLHCVQSNVSARIKQLEEDLNISLFNRGRQKLTLTPAGKTLLSFAEKIAIIAKEAEKTINDINGKKSSIYIGFMETATAIKLHTVLISYHERYPESNVKIVTGTTEELYRNVLDNEIDGAFIEDFIEHPDIELKLIFEEKLALISNTNIDDFRNRNILVLKKEHFYREKLKNFLNAKNVYPDKTFELDSLEELLAYASAGMGIAIFPLSVLKENHKNKLSLKILTENQYKISIYFIKRRDTLTTKALSNFIELLHNFKI
ncbi:MAG: LysR family transcriptional regulator [Candidatus Acidulodesulfobacterium sp.]